MTTKPQGNPVLFCEWRVPLQVLPMAHETIPHISAEKCPELSLVPSRPIPSRVDGIAWRTPCLFRTMDRHHHTALCGFIIEKKSTCQSPMLGGSNPGILLPMLRSIHSENCLHCKVQRGSKLDAVCSTEDLKCGRPPSLSKASTPYFAKAG
ncbi:hypothetical protein VTO42DRAFT_8374 [Malbranchea cinnamomea]